MKNINCLISGLSGYTGSRLANFAAAKGATVTGLLRKTSKIPALNPRVKIEIIPDSDEEFAKLVARIKPDIGFMVAGRFLKNEEARQTSVDIDGNFAFAVRFAAALRNSPGCRLINMASYWEFDENGETHGNTEYAALKSAYTHFLSALPKRLRVPFMSVVNFDTYGPGDWRQKVFDAIITHCQSGAKFDLTKGEQLMNLVHIDDVCQGLWLAGTDGFEDGAVRALPARKLLTLRDLVTLVEKSAEKKANFNFGAKPYPEHQIFKPTQKLKTVKGWEPQIELEEGIRQCLKN
ncbi:MAG: NAD-dependent epimerase/dehydratase family protein [Bdellovibrionales bacterium]